MFTRRIQVLKKWWELAPPKTKRTIIMSTVLIVGGLSIFVSSLLFKPKKKKRVKITPPKIEIISKQTQRYISESAAVRRLKHKVNKLRTDVDEVKKELFNVKKDIANLNEALNSYQGQIDVFQNKLIEKAGKLEEIIKEVKTQKKISEKKNVKSRKVKTNIKQEEKFGQKKKESILNIWDKSFSENGTQYVGILSRKDLKKEWETPKKINLETGKPKKLVSEIKESNLPKKEETKSKFKNITIRIPAGSFFRGILLNGVDAPVTMVAKKNPYPVLIKVKTEAWLPNEYRYDIKGCYIVAAAWGDMSSERAYFRTERFSCIKKDGGMIETTIDGSVTDGQDGKLGVFGKLVSKQGQMIARTILAEVIQGFGNALSPRQGIPIYNIDEDSDSDYYTTPPIGRSFRYGLFSGTGEAMKRIANFYLKMAEQTFPVIEVQAGIPVEVFLLRGVTLTLKKKTENNGGVDNAAG